MSKPSEASRLLAVQPVYPAAKAINRVIHTAPAGAAYFRGIVLITMATGRLVRQQESLAHAALPSVLQLRWGGRLSDRCFPGTGHAHQNEDHTVLY